MAKAPESPIWLLANNRRSILRFFIERRQWESERAVRSFMELLKKEIDVGVGLCCRWWYRSWELDSDTKSNAVEE